MLEEIRLFIKNANLFNSYLNIQNCEIYATVHLCEIHVFIPFYTIFADLLTSD
jgi:hypothetical protein